MSTTRKTVPTPPTMSTVAREHRSCASPPFGSDSRADGAPSFEGWPAEFPWVRGCFGIDPEQHLSASIARRGSFAPTHVAQTPLVASLPGLDRSHPKHCGSPLSWRCKRRACLMRWPKPSHIATEHNVPDCERDAGDALPRRRNITQIVPRGAFRRWMDTVVPKAVFRLSLVGIASQLPTPFQSPKHRCLTTTTGTKTRAEGGKDTDRRPGPSTPRPQRL